MINYLKSVYDIEEVSTPTKLDRFSSSAVMTDCDGHTYQVQLTPKSNSDYVRFGYYGGE